MVFENYFTLYMTCPCNALGCYLLPPMITVSDVLSPQGFTCSKLQREFLEISHLHPECSNSRSTQNCHWVAEDRLGTRGGG